MNYIQFLENWGKLRFLLLNLNLQEIVRTAFITFESIHYIDDAIKLNGIVLRDHILIIEKMLQEAVKGRECPHSIDENHRNDKCNFKYKPKCIFKPSVNGWKSSKYIQDSTDEIIIKEVRDLLNKITDKTTEKIGLKLEEVIINIENEILLKDAVHVFYDKIISESVFAPLYAQLCKNIASKLPMFRKIILNFCQETFEKDDMVVPIELTDKILIEEWKNKEKNKILGNVCFIAELFKIKMVTENIIDNCIGKLLNTNEKNIEQLCHLLKNIGSSLNISKIDNYFKSLQELISSTTFSNRIKFMIQDIISLRKINGKKLKKLKKLEKLSKLSKLNKSNKSNKLKKLKKL